MSAGRGEKDSGSGYAWKELRGKRKRMGTGEKRCIGCMRMIPSGQRQCPHCGFMEEYYQPEFYTLPAGQRLQNGRYELGHAVGEGGFGITYIGWDAKFARVVAIKEFYSKALVSRDNTVSRSVRLYRENDEASKAAYRKEISRVEREARLIRRFEDCPGLVRVEDFFSENNTVYIVMDYIEGITLRAYCGQHGTVDVRRFAPLIQSLHKMHREGIIHRDLSMDNIMIQQDGSLKILDFGSARPVQNETMSVTVKYGYAAPEQYDPTAENQGPWIDVYELCVCIWNNLTGEKLKDAKLRKESLERGGKNLPRGIRETLLKGLELDYRKRIQNMNELYHGLYGTWLEPVDEKKSGDPYGTEQRDPYSSRNKNQNPYSTEPYGTGNTDPYRAENPDIYGTGDADFGAFSGTWEDGYGNTGHRDRSGRGNGAGFGKSGGKSEKKGFRLPKWFPIAAGAVGVLAAVIVLSLIVSGIVSGKGDDEDGIETAAEATETPAPTVAAKSTEEEDSITAAAESEGTVSEDAGTEEESEQSTAQSEAESAAALAEAAQEKAEAAEEQALAYVTGETSVGYVGEQTDGLQDGCGVYYFASGASYAGEWADGSQNGNGIFYYVNGDIYAGEWADDLANGYGVYIWEDGSRYEGHFVNGVKSGYGIYYLTDGSVQAGSWKGGAYQG